MTGTEGRFELIEGLPADVVGVRAEGRIGRAAYETTLIPLLEARIAREGKVKLLYVLGPEFGGFTAGAAWDDARVGLLHLADFAAIAVVSDVEWIRLGVKMFAPMIPAPVAVFHMAELAQAKDWIVADRLDDHDSVEVAADHKIPPFEDKGPPK